MVPDGGASQVDPRELRDLPFWPASVFWWVLHPVEAPPAGLRSRRSVSGGRLDLEKIREICGWERHTLARCAPRAFEPALPPR